MKFPLIGLLLVLSLAANGYLWYRVDRLEHPAAAKADDYPLGENMGYLQRYADKLWYAGTANNWELADFYHDELVEIAEDIGHANVTKDGVDVSKLITSTLPPALETLDQAISAKDAERFRTAYDGMVTSCNTCHVAAKHPFIQIAPPKGEPTYWNQKF